MHPHLTPKDIERFWSRVDKTETCWLWTGVRHHGEPGYAYGLFAVYRPRLRRFFAHRVSYELTYGPIEAGLYVCHHCDNPPCVRPDHLFLGTQADNIRDAKAKDRMFRGPREPAKVGRGPCKARRGNQNGRTRRTPEQVRAVRALRAQGLSQDKIAKRVGIPQASVSEILRGVRWADVV